MATTNHADPMQAQAKPAKAGSFPVSDHCDGRRFFNPTGHVNRTFREILRWRRTSKPAPWPKSVPIAPIDAPSAPSDGRAAATWVGHATFLVQTHGLGILTDPVWSDRVGPAGLVGPRRVHPPALRFESLPRIHVVLLSHDHYDHCDLPTLSRLARTWDPVVVTPLGNGALARRAGRRRVIELDWWQSCEPVPGLPVTLTPSRHWCNRMTGPRNSRLWGGFTFGAGEGKIHFVGDTGYDPELFVEIRHRLGAPRLAMIPIGAYEPRWFMAPQHCNPEEAVQIHRDLGSAASVAMHWGCWQLTDEAREAPANELIRAREAAGLDDAAFRVLQPGQSIGT